MGVWKAWTAASATSPLRCTEEGGVIVGFFVEREQRGWSGEGASEEESEQSIAGDCV